MAKPSPVPGLTAHTAMRRAAQELLAARLSDLRALENGARVLEMEKIHDLRVATRRLRAALDIFCNASGDDEVQSLGHALGAVRDLQVELSWIESRVPNRTERERVAAALRLRLARAGRQLQLALTRWAERDVSRVVRAFGKARDSGRLGGGWGAARLKAGLGDLKPKIKVLREAVTPEETHALRKRVKRLRYEAELFAAAYPRTVKKWSAALSSLQSRLGDMHDADLRCAWLDHNRVASQRLRDLADKEREALSRQLEREIESWHREDRLRDLRRSLWG